MAGFLKKLLKDEHAGILEDLIGKSEKRDMYAGDPSLDWCVKSWHTGGINLIYGPSGSGKSAIALKAAAEAWAKNPDSYVMIYDSEFFYYKNKENMERVRQFGLDPTKVIFKSDNTIADLFKTLPDLEEDLNSGAVKLAALIVDSLGGIQNLNAENKILKGEAEAAGDAHRGNAKSMNPILGVLNRLGAKHNIPMFIVQHCIKNQEQYGDKWVLIGGERLKYLSQRALCVESSQARDGKLCEGDVPFDPSNPDATIVGKKILAKCVKSRGGMEGGKVEFWFNFRDARFARPGMSLFTLAVNLGIIYHPEINGRPNNSWWAYNMIGKEIKVHGAGKMQELLESDKELFARVNAECRSSTKSAATPEKMSAFADTDGAGDKDE